MTNKKYWIDSSNELIFLTFSGDISLEDVKEVELKLETEANYSSSFHRIYDIRYCSLNIDVDDLPSYIDFEKEELITDDYRKEIYLTSKPNQVVLMSIYEDLIVSSHNLETYTVSTTDTAAKILSNSYDKELIDKILKELNTSGKE